MKKCSEKAFALCPDRAVCGSLKEAVYMEGSECEKFNESVEEAEGKTSLESARGDWGTGGSGISITKCTNCAWENPVGSYICGKCGRPLWKEGERP